MIDRKLFRFSMVLFLILTIYSTLFGISTKLLRLTYNEFITENIVQWEYSFSKSDDGYILKMLKNNFSAIVKMDTNLNTQSLRIIQEHNRKFTAQRDGYDLYFNNVSRGETKNKSIDIYKQKWHGDFFLLKDFVLSDKKEEKFLMAMLYNQSVIKLKAIKENTDVIEVNGKEYKTIKVRITLQDWRSMFWSSYFWFRKSDGILVKSEEHRGPPGTPLTTMELVGER